MDMAKDTPFFMGMTNFRGTPSRKKNYYEGRDKWNQIKQLTISPLCKEKFGKTPSKDIKI